MPPFFEYLDTTLLYFENCDMSTNLFEIFEIIVDISEITIYTLITGGAA